MYQFNVLHLKLCSQICFSPYYNLLCTCEKKIIHVKHQYKWIITNKYEVQARIHLTLGKAHTLQVSVNLGIPCDGFLFESTQGFIKPTHIRIPPMFLKTLRFLYIYFFLNELAKEICIDIHLVNPPPRN
jgi:hypothetical protein